MTKALPNASLSIIGHTLGKVLMHLRDIRAIGCLSFYANFERRCFMSDSVCSPENPCTTMQLVSQRVDIMEQMLKKLENRLPLWASMMFAGMSGTIGFLASKVM